MQYEDPSMNPFGDKEEAPPAQVNQEPGPAETCAHMVLIPRWDSVEDMGHKDKVVGYKCDACATSFTLEEAEIIQRSHHVIIL